MEKGGKIMQLFQLKDYLEELDSDYEVIIECDLDGTGKYTLLKLDDICAPVINKNVRIRLSL